LKAVHAGRNHPESGERHPPTYSSWLGYQRQPGRVPVSILLSRLPSLRKPLWSKKVYKLTSGTTKSLQPAKDILDAAPSAHDSRAYTKAPQGLDRPARLSLQGHVHRHPGRVHRALDRRALAPEPVLPDLRARRLRDGHRLGGRTSL